MRRYFLVLLSVALLAFATAAHDDGGMGTLAGTVVGKSGKPVAGARVTSQNAGGDHPETTVSNEQGRFFFPDLPHGYYDARAYHAGEWSEWKQNLEVSTGKQTEVLLRLTTKSAAGR
ncbi:MAG: carboxypeptidase-like regulatory domain-containing protein [Candidatus Acidiferrales bacterium]